MDFYSTFLCLPPLQLEPTPSSAHHPQPHQVYNNPPPTTATRTTTTTVASSSVSSRSPSSPSSGAPLSTQSDLHHSETVFNNIRGVISKNSPSAPVSRTLSLTGGGGSPTPTITNHHKLLSQFQTGGTHVLPPPGSASLSSIADHRLPSVTPIINRTDGQTAPHQAPPNSIPLVSRIPSRISTTPSSNPPQLGPPLSPRSDPSSSTSKYAQRNPSPSPDVVQAVCDDLMSKHHCLVTATHSVGSGSYGFHISGSFSQVMAARGRLLREQPFEVEEVVGVQRSDVLQGGANVSPVIRFQLDEIASSTRAHLSIVGNYQYPTDSDVDIVIRGDREAVEDARVRLLILFDQLAGLHTEACEIDYKLHQIITGRRRSVIQSIQEETATNIYFPSNLSGGGVLSTKHPNFASRRNMIIITGEFFGVQRAREMIFQVSIHKSKCIISRDTTILPRKLDWLLMEKLPVLHKIMYDNGTFISFPPIGSQISVVSIYGDHRVHVERTIRSLMQLACEFYIANLWLLPSVYTSQANLSASQTHHHSPISQSEIGTDGHRIALETGAEIVFKSTNSFEIYGSDQSVKHAIKKIMDLDFVKRSQVEIRFQVELACEHRDFISGKKNGKLNKIMKSSNVKIKFDSFNDYNFMIDLSGDATTGLMGLRLLEEELPAEISFHVPEAYHKRIIGVGGKNIQRIMKKYGVYVKFSNAEEFASLGGYQDNHDNVVARTPAKNADNLEQLKQSVMELVHPKDKDFITEQMKISRHYHRSILGEKSIFIHDIESKTNTCFYFPSSESRSETIDIFGPKSQIAIARQMMMIHIGLESDYRLTATTELLQWIRSEEFEERVIRHCKRLWNMTVLVINGVGESEEVVIKFGLNRANSDNLRQAQEVLEAFLIEKNINFQHDRITSGLRQHRRGTVTSIGSMDRGSAGSFTPVTPSDTLGFGSLQHHSSEKDLRALFDRPGHHMSGGSGFPVTPLSNSTSTYSHHPSLSISRLYNPLGAFNGPGSSPTAAGNTLRNSISGSSSSLSDWSSVPRQMIKNNYASSNNLIGAPPAGMSMIPPNPIGSVPKVGSGYQSRRNLSLIPNPPNSTSGLIGRKSVISPRAQSIDLGKPTVGGEMLMMRPLVPSAVNNGLGSIGSSSLLSSQVSAGETANSLPGMIDFKSAVNSRVGGGFHRHRLSQGSAIGFNPMLQSSLVNGFGGLNL